MIHLFGFKRGRIVSARKGAPHPPVLLEKLETATIYWHSSPDHQTGQVVGQNPQLHSVTRNFMRKSETASAFQLEEPGTKLCSWPKSPCCRLSRAVQWLHNYQEISCWTVLIIQMETQRLPFTRVRHHSQNEEVLGATSIGIRTRERHLHDDDQDLDQSCVVRFPTSSWKGEIKPHLLNVSLQFGWKQN